MLFLALIAASALAPAAQALAPVKIPDQPELTRQIAQADVELFHLFFEGKCDVPRFRAMLTDDVEFYHDKGGFIVRKPEDFVAFFEERCRNHDDPNAYTSRRELVPGTLHVDPVPGWGAMEAGDHIFYEKHGFTGAERLAGKAKFAMVWVLGQDGKWRVSRVLSFAHEAAKP